MADGTVSYKYKILDGFSKPLEKMFKTIEKLDAKLLNINNTQKDFNMSLFKGANRISEATRKLNIYNNKLTETSKKAGQASRSNDKFLKKLNGTQPQTLGGGLLGAGAGTFGAILPLKAAVDFEFAMAKVAKAAQIDRASDSFKKLNKEVVTLSKTTGLMPVQMAGLFEAGAKTGLRGGDLEIFTDRVSKMSMALDLVPEEAGKMLAQMMAQMKIPISGLEDFTDAINYLGDNSITNGEAIINVLSRVSGQMSLLEVPPDLAAGMATFARVVSPTTELAASGLEMVLAKMQQIPAMRKALIDDPEKAFKKLLTTLSKMDKESRMVTIQDEFGADAGKFLLKAVEGLGKYNETMDLMRDKTARAGSVNKEFETIMSTARGQINRNKASIFSAARSIGEAFLPVILELTTKVMEITEAIAKWSAENPELVRYIGYAIAALIAIKIATIALGFIFGGIISTIMGLMKGFSLLRIAGSGVWSIITKISSILLPLKGIIVSSALKLGLFAKSMFKAGKALKFLRFGVRALVGATGIGLLLVAADLVISNWDKVYSFITTVLNNVKNLFKESMLGKLLDKTFGLFSDDNEINVNESSVSKNVSERLSKDEVSINGNIGITATGGTVHDSSIDLGGNSGDLGFNMEYGR